MLFSFTKAIFATLALGTALVSAAPAPETAIAKRGGDDLLTLIADLQVSIQDDCDQLTALAASADVTVVLITPIVADIVAKIDAATATCEGYDSSDWSDVTAVELSVAITALVTEIIVPIEACKQASGGDAAVLEVFAQIDVSLGAFLSCILTLVWLILSILEALLVIALSSVVFDLTDCGFSVCLGVLGLA